MSKSLMINNQAHEPIYEIVFETAFEKLAEKVKQIGLEGRKVCIVMDSNTSHLYGEMVRKVLEPVSAKVISFQFPAGELHKTLDIVRDIYKELIEAHFDRKDYLAALGGGVVGDITGFAAATYLRGISFIQIPTTLLSQSDSSVGGKTGVDFDGYKNMVGAFCMPKLVYMNMSVLKSLSKRLFNSGFGEIIKHGLIKDKEYYNWLKDNADRIKALDPDALEHMIYVSCNIKREVVENDPKEKGERALLNFGHTLGHAIEKEMNFSLYHGECVVLGMIAALNICVELGTITANERDDALKTFALYEFPDHVTGIKIDDVVAVSKNDKKMDAGKVKFILLKSVGDAYIDRDITDDQMRRALEGVIR